MPTCPRCAGALLDTDTQCSRCREKVIRCSCGASNRMMARYCRTCGQRLRRSHEWRLPHGSMTAAGFYDRTIPFMPVIEFAYRANLEANIAGQGVCGYGHLFFPVQEKGVVVLAAGEKRIRSRFCGLSKTPHTLAITDEFLLIAGKGGLEAVSLFDLMQDRKTDVSVWSPDPIISANGFGLTVYEEASMAFVCTTNEVRGYSLSTGQQMWAVRRDESGPAMLVLVEKRLVVLEAGGTVGAYDPRSGRKLWQEKFLSSISMRAGCTAWDDHLYLFLRDGTLAVLVVKEKDGAMLPLPHHRFGEATGMATDGKHLYVAGARGLHSLIPTESNAMLLFEQVSYAAPLVTRGTVFASAGEEGSLFYASSSASQSRYQRCKGFEDLCSTSPLLVDQHLYLASERGEVAVYTCREGGVPS